MEELLERLLAECLPYTAQGRLADYIPELAKADPSMLGVYVIGNDGKESWAGDCRQPFTIQSVIKPILLLQALLDNGVEAVQRRVGVEATGKTLTRSTPATSRWTVDTSTPWSIWAQS